MEGEFPSPPSAPELDGWEARYIGQDPRLSEVVELYRELGFEVRIEPFRPDSSDGCTVCFEGSPELFMVVYTRAKGGDDSEEMGSELF